MATPPFFVVPTAKKIFFFITENKKDPFITEEVHNISYLSEMKFRGIWHQHNIFFHDITGCRASQGPFPPPLLIRVRYIFFLANYNIKKQKSQFLFESNICNIKGALRGLVISLFISPPIF